MGNFYSRSLLQGDTWATPVTLMSDGAAIVSAVMTNPNALGLVDMSYINLTSEAVRVVAIKSDPDTTCAAERASPLHECTRSFPFARLAYLYAHHAPSTALDPVLAELINFALSVEGQVRTCAAAACCNVLARCASHPLRV